MKSVITPLLRRALATLLAGTGIQPPEVISLEPTKEAQHGHYATNVALTLAKALRKSPRQVADEIVGALPASPLVAKAEVAGPGFINFFLAPAAFQSLVVEILRQGRDYGRSHTGAGRKAMVEFVSANPTGPLHVGHGRGAAVGDCLARLLEATGWDTNREFYYNDAGVQIENLAVSVQARCRGIVPGGPGWVEEGYRGEYISDVAQAYLDGETVKADDQDVTGGRNPNDLDAIRRFAVAYLRREQDTDLKAFGIHFNVYYLESSLYSAGLVDRVVEDLVKSGHTYEEGDSLWLRTTDFGDDKDRVMRKRVGGYTYFVPDVAYHVTKWKRGYERVINEQGADHHGTVARVRAGLQALDIGIPKNWPEYVLHQMVTVMRGGQEVKLGKRAGGYVTLGNLIEEVGRDAARFFLVARKTDSHLVFDIDLARSQTSENPVYYIQYAHARICGVFRQMAERGMPAWNETEVEASVGRLTDPVDLALIAELARYPDIVATAAELMEPHLVAQYLRDLAAAFHGFYKAQQLLVDDVGLRNARLSLAVACRHVLCNGLDLIGVSAPEVMGPRD